MTTKTQILVNAFRAVAAFVVLVLAAGFGVAIPAEVLASAALAFEGVLYAAVKLRDPSIPWAEAFRNDNVTGMKNVRSGPRRGQSAYPKRLASGPKARKRGRMGRRTHGTGQVKWSKRRSTKRARPDKR